MAFSVTLYENFKKKTNSTKTPDNTVTQRTFQNVEIKEQSSLINPVIKFLFDGSAKFMEYNYAYIPYFKRYYFIDNIVYNGGRYEASLTCDVLASYKTDIGNSTQYVLRSTALQNVDIPDIHFPKTDVVTHKIYSVSPIFASTLDGGMYVVGIVNSAENTRGCTSYYAMTNEQFRALSNFLLSDPAYMGISPDEISSNLQRALINPFQYITTAMWLPVKFNPVSTTNITVGWWTATGVTGMIIPSDATIKYSFDINLHKHPQTNTRGDWVNGNIGTQIYLILPPFGKIAIDANSIIHNNAITVNINIDSVSGNAVLTIYGKKNSETIEDSSYSGMLYYGETNIAIQMPVNAIGQSGNIYSMQTMWSFLSSNVGGIINDVNNLFNTTIDPGIGTILNAPNISATKSGGSGSMASYGTLPKLCFDFFQFAPDNNADYGRPLCEQHKISELPGFILCETNDIEIAGTREESEKIGNYLTGGFFYE